MSAILARGRLFLLLARPPLLLLLAMSGALGAASAGAALDPVPTVRALLVVVPFVVYAVSLNDLADVAVDRVNLAADPSRPLVAGTAREREVRTTAAAGLVLAALLAASVGLRALVVVVVGAVVAAAYSRPGTAIGRRGIVGPLVLPLGLLAVPFLVGVDAAGGTLGTTQVALLLALYAGFVGRLLLKDFRDVSGDALLGKRTFLVRHGRRATCAVSAVLWLLGSLALLAVPGPRAVLALCWGSALAAALVLLVRLARPSTPRRDERLVSGLAQCGRLLVLLLLLHLGLVERGSSPVLSATLLLAMTVLLLADAVHVAVHGAVRPGAVPPWPGARPPARASDATA